MPDNGVRSTDLDTLSLADDLIANRDGNIGRIPITSLRQPGVITDRVYDSPAALNTSLESPRGEGALWATKDGLQSVEVAPTVAFPGYLRESSGGVKRKPTPFRTVDVRELCGVDSRSHSYATDYSAGVAQFRDFAESIGGATLYIPELKQENSLQEGGHFPFAERIDILPKKPRLGNAISIVGQGRRSHLRCIATSGHPGGQTGLLTPGNWKASGQHDQNLLGGQMQYDLQPFEAGQHILPLVNGTDSVNLEEGMPVRIFSKTGSTQPTAYTSGLSLTVDGHATGFIVEHGGYLYAPRVAALPFVTTATFDPTKWDLLDGTHRRSGYALYQELNVIESIVGGVPILRYPTYKACSDARIAPADGTDTALVDWAGDPSRVLLGFEMRNVGVSLAQADTRPWAVLGALLDCTLENIYVWDSASLWNSNAVARSVLRNFQGYFREKAVNCAYFSHHSVLDGFRGVTGTSPSDLAVQANIMVHLEENAHHMHYRGLNFEAGPHSQISEFIKITKAAEGNTIESFKFSEHKRNGGVVNSGIFLSFDSDNGMPASGNIIRNGEIDSVNVDTPFSVNMHEDRVGEDLDTLIDNVRFRNGSPIGPGGDARVATLGGSGITLRNTATTRGTRINTASGTGNNKILGHDFGQDRLIYRNVLGAASIQGCTDPTTVGFRNGAVIGEALNVARQAGAITGAAQTSPVTITEVGHGYVSGDFIVIRGVGGMTSLNDKTYQITVLDADSYALDGVDGTGFAAFSSGGMSIKCVGVADFKQVLVGGVPTGSIVGLDRLAVEFLGDIDGTNNSKTFGITVGGKSFVLDAAAGEIDHIGITGSITVRVNGTARFQYFTSDELSVDPQSSTLQFSLSDRNLIGFWCVVANTEDKLSVQWSVEPKRLGVNI